MTPIRSICPECLAKFTDALDQIPADRQAMLNTYCTHHGIALSAHIAPGHVIHDWGLFPAATPAAAQAKVQVAQLQAEIMQVAAAHAQTQAATHH